MQNSDAQMIFCSKYVNLTTFREIIKSLRELYNISSTVNPPYFGGSLIFVEINMSIHNALDLINIAKLRTAYDHPLLSGSR